ncbi:hypothetical protein ACA910_016894 [Epithemia clementina (nom. ined.)]
MPRLYGGVNARKMRALACQADEEELFSAENCPPKHGNEAEESEKSRLSRSLNILRCFSPLAVLRELRNGGSLKDESVELICDSTQAKYYLVVEETDPCGEFDGSEVRLLFRGGTLNSGHNLIDELFDSTGSLKVVEEGNEWEEDNESEEEQEKAFPECSSPSTQTTVRSELSFQAMGSPINDEVFKESSFDLDRDEHEPNHNTPQQSSRIGIQPISKPISFPLLPSELEHGSLRRGSRRNRPKQEYDLADCTEQPTNPGSAKPDPPASSVSDTHFGYQYTTHADEEPLNKLSSISITKKPDCDRTVVSELTCDSFSDFVASRPEQAVFEVVQEPPKNDVEKEHPKNVVEKEQVQQQELPKVEETTNGEECEVRSSKSQESSKKMKDLISKFESLSSCKVSLERFSVISKIQREQVSGVSQSSSSCPCPADEPPSEAVEENAESRERGFFWRSRPNSQETGNISSPGLIHTDSRTVDEIASTNDSSDYRNTFHQLTRRLG